MRPVRVHMPGKPSSDLPDRLSTLVDHYQPQPPVVRWGVTATTDGRWALLVSVPADTKVPLAQVEASAQGFPVIYEAEPDEPIRPQKK